MCRIPILGLKFEFSITILLGPMTSYYKILHRKKPVYYKITFIKNVYYKNVTQKTDSNCPLVIFLFFSLPAYALSFFFLPHYDTILYIAVIVIFLCLGFMHIFFEIISNFILLERPLSLKLML